MELPTRLQETFEGWGAGAEQAVAWVSLTKFSCYTIFIVAGVLIAYEKFARICFSDLADPPKEDSDDEIACLHRINREISKHLESIKRNGVCPTQFEDNFDLSQHAQFLCRIVRRRIEIAFPRIADRDIYISVFAAENLISTEDSPCEELSCLASHPTHNLAPESPKIAIDETGLEDVCEAFNQNEPSFKAVIGRNSGDLRSLRKQAPKRLAHILTLPLKADSTSWGIIRIEFFRHTCFSDHDQMVDFYTRHLRLTERIGEYVGLKARTFAHFSQHWPPLTN